MIGMKKIMALVFLILVFSAANAQEMAIANIKYSFSHMRDTTTPGDLYTENMMLYLGKNTSNYISYDRVQYNKLIAKQLSDSNAMMAKGRIEIGMAGVKSGTPSSIFKKTAETKMVSVEPFLGKTYIIEEKIPVINWQISGETKTIEGLSCQKATAQFKGRDYEAWFCAQLPYSNGPWKLGGLPGLIIEAYDTKRQVVFKFAGYEDISNEAVTISYPSNTIKTTDKELKQLKEAVQKDPSAYLNGALAGSGANGNPKAVMDIKMASMNSGSFVSNGTKRKVINNPIELTN